MQRKRSLTLFLLAVVAICTRGAAQSGYDAHQAFAPLFYTAAGNQFRSADGSPGPAYWQNQADYAVSASFDTSSNMISGRVEITYTNNSPDDLLFLWFQMDQNINRKDSRASVMQHPGAAENGENGYLLQKVQVMAHGQWNTASYIINDTRMQVRLPEALPGKGGKLQLAITYQYRLRASGGGGRSGYLDTRNGRIYECSYWYPRLCVYDDLQGWNTLPFLGSEFYLDYGNIDYKVTLPSGMLVAGSGELLNEAEVLTDKILSRLQQARRSDSTVMIRTAEEAATRNKGGTTTWHFRMQHTRDVAWAASSAFVWDAARIRLPEGRTSLAMSFYPAESVGNNAWERATEYVKHAVELFSKHWFVYPYPAAINVGGPVGGMEFPGITFDHWKARGKDLWALLAHEIGHNWFPMIVGSNERRNAWMDEGFNTFIDIYASDEFNQGEYAPKRDGEYAPGGGNPADEIVPVIAQPGIPPVMTNADAISGKDVHPLEYFKTAFGLVLLREMILGPDRFDMAFKKYIHDWAFKHPSPIDFFRAIENGAGEDLSWFWRGWFLHNWQLDQAVRAVHYVNNDPAQGALITIENRDRMVFPVTVKVEEENGRVQDIRLPVETWQRGGTWTFRVSSGSRITHVILDPDHRLPDADRSNNEWKGL